MWFNGEKSGGSSEVVVPQRRALVREMDERTLKKLIE